MRKLITALCLLGSVVSASAAGLTAHIGCWGDLGVERGCAGSAITCINTAQSDLPLRFDSLVVNYTEANGEVSIPEEQMGKSTTVRLPISDTFGVIKFPYHVVTTKPNGELDVVYLIPTEEDEVGRFVIHARSRGQVDFPLGAGNWSATYGLTFQLVDCAAVPSSAAQAFVAGPPAGGPRMHKMHVRKHRP